MENQLSIWAWLIWNRQLYIYGGLHLPLIIWGRFGRKPDKRANILKSENNRGKYVWRATKKISARISFFRGGQNKHCHLLVFRGIWIIERSWRKIYQPPTSGSFRQLPYVLFRAFYKISQTSFIFNTLHLLIKLLQYKDLHTDPD